MTDQPLESIDADYRPAAFVNDMAIDCDTDHVGETRAQALALITIKPQLIRRKFAVPPEDLRAVHPVLVIRRASVERGQLLSALLRDADLLELKPDPRLRIGKGSSRSYAMSEADWIIFDEQRRVFDLGGAEFLRRLVYQFLNRSRS